MIFRTNRSAARPQRARLFEPRRVRTLPLYLVQRASSALARIADAASRLEYSEDSAKVATADGGRVDVAALPGSAPVEEAFGFTMVPSGLRVRFTPREQRGAAPPL